MEGMIGPEYAYAMTSDEASDELIFWGTYHASLGNVLRAGAMADIALERAERVALGVLDLHRRRGAERAKKRQD